MPFVPGAASGRSPPFDRRGDRRECVPVIGGARKAVSIAPTPSETLTAGERCEFGAVRTGSAGLFASHSARSSWDLTYCRSRRTFRARSMLRLVNSALCGGGGDVRRRRWRCAAVFGGHFSLCGRLPVAFSVAARCGRRLATARFLTPASRRPATVGGATTERRRDSSSRRDVTIGDGGGLMRRPGSRGNGQNCTG